MTWREWFDRFLDRGQSGASTMAECWAADLHRSGLSEDTPSNRKKMHVYLARLRERFPHTIRPVNFAGWHGIERVFTDGSRCALYPELPGRVYFSEIGDTPPPKAPELGELPSAADRVAMLVVTGEWLARMEEDARKAMLASAAPHVRDYLSACLTAYQQRRS